MNWMTSWMLCAGALLVSGCDAPCPAYDLNQPYVPTQVVAGSGRLVLSCANMPERVLILSAGSQYDSVRYLTQLERKLELVLEFDPPPGEQTPPLTLGVLIPGTHEDGEYRLGTDSKNLHFHDDDVDYTLPTAYQGTLTFQRSRPVPLIDEEEPAEGPYHYTFDGTVELEGRMPAAVLPDCTGPISFKLEPVSFHMEQNNYITTCRLSDARAGGH